VIARKWQFLAALVSSEGIAKGLGGVKRGSLFSARLSVSFRRPNIPTSDQAAASNEADRKQKTKLDSERPPLDHEVTLADRFFCNYWVIADSLRRGVGVVFRLHQTREADFRRGRQLGPDDHY
jgi:hypothetical protein